MRGQSKTTKLSKTREKRGRPSRDWFLVCAWLAGKFLDQSQSKIKQNQCNSDYFRELTCT